MGCSMSFRSRKKMTKSEKAIKAALLIQGWYRRYSARLEAKRRATWAIFQSIEYAGEQNQLHLSRFFKTMLEQFSLDGDEHNALMRAFGVHNHASVPAGKATAWAQQMDGEEKKLTDLAHPDNFPLDKHYDGPKLTFPVTRDQIKDVVSAFKDRKILHPRYLMDLLLRARQVLMTQPTINRVSTTLSGQITVCGDLHGKLDDLYIIFQKNGLPGLDNPYIFNGDFVDRGPQSVEVMALLLICLLHAPNHIYLNRGNHEDHAMNIRYGFTKEIIQKYKAHSMKVVQMFQEVFRWLPLATIIDNQVLVVHGGMSDQVDLSFVEKIDRQKFLTILRPPSIVPLNAISEEDLDLCEMEEWRQILDLLWSDPRSMEGCCPNTFRGGGCCFGQDVTSRFLESRNFSMIIRSHECKEEGYEYTHGGKLLTIFSTSNYYEEGSNKGAYAKIMGYKTNDAGLPEPDIHLVQFMVPSKRGRKLTFTERISHLESSALSHLRDHILSNRSTLEKEFSSRDNSHTGCISVNAWCQVMEEVMGIEVPWRLLSRRLVQHLEEKADSRSQLVRFQTTFQAKRVSLTQWQKEGPSVTESLYRHKDVLETIFRTFDRDSSGQISMEEFTESCHILMQHANISLNKSQVSDIARCLDLNKDGNIDFNEFLEAFRIVDSHDRYSGGGGMGGVLGGILESHQEGSSTRESGYQENSSGALTKPSDASNAPSTLVPSSNDVPCCVVAS